MNVKIIPKEQLTAYQRWELGGVNDGNAKPGEGSPLARPNPNQPVSLTTAEEVERIHQEAWQEGHKLGHEEGFKAGFAEGGKEGVAYAERLKLMVESLDTARLQQDEQLAREILNLSLTIAREMVRSSLRIKPELVLEIVQEAIAALPGLTGHTRLVTHPDLAPVIRDWLATEHAHLSWKVVEDVTMEPGGVRVENAHSELDASMESRWREIIATLGGDVQWLSD